MKIVTGEAQDVYWKKTGYRSADDPTNRAYALPKVRYIERFVDLRNARILDVGCGTGAFTILFNEHTPSVVGLDYSEFMVRQSPGSVRLCAIAEQLPFADNTFDIAFVANLLHHTADPSIVVAELARVASRNVVLLEPNRANPIMLLFSLIVREERGGLRSSRAFLRRLLKGCGMEVLCCNAMGMISQNNTPDWMVPLLKRFDREIWWGEYLIAIGKKS